MLNLIKTEAEYHVALKRLGEVFGAPTGTPESDECDLLALLLGAYEDEHYPMDDGKPLDVLLYLMEANDLKQADLVNVIGSSGVVSEVVNGKRQISKNQAQALGKFFHVDPKLFL